MSTRERAAAIITITLTVAGWLLAVALALVLWDANKVFALAVTGASLLTVSLIVRAAVRASAKTVTTILISQKAETSIPIPVEIVHQVGFKQGWEAHELAHPDQLLDLVDVFERRFPTPPN